MSGQRNGLTIAVALAVVGASASALTAYPPTAAPAPAGSWLALSLLYEGNAMLVTAPCGATTAEGSGSQEPPPPPPKTDQPPPAAPPIGCLPVGPPTTTGRRAGVYVGIAVAAAAGIGAAIAVGGGRHPTSAP